jgi:hypothetical protein
MDDGQLIDDLVATYYPLIDQSAGSYDAEFEADGRPSVSDLRRQLRVRFRADDRLERIRFRIDGHDVGITSRGIACADEGVAGPSGPEPGLGDSDRATQPGYSTRYRAIEFECGTCRRRVRMSYYDEREVPRCPHPDGSDGRRGDTRRSDDRMRVVRG